MATCWGSVIKECEVERKQSYPRSHFHTSVRHSPSFWGFSRQYWCHVATSPNNAHTNSVDCLVLSRDVAISDRGFLSRKKNYKCQER